MAKKIAVVGKKSGIDWSKFENTTGEVITAGSRVNVIELGPGESFIGKYIGIEEIQLGDKEPFDSLQFETKNGKQCIAGVSLVQQMRMININSVVRVTKNKAKKTEAGFKVGQFTVELLEGSKNEKEVEKIKQEIKEAIKKKEKSNKKGKK